MSDQWPPKETAPLWPTKRLVERIAQFNIPVEAFRFAAKFDRVLVWQIPDDLAGNDEIDLGEGKKIIKAERTVDRERRENPRGVIISAGLTALDQLRSHGTDLGNIVRFTRLAIWRLLIAREDGKDREVIPLRVDNIVLDEDEAIDLHSGVLKRVQTKDLGEHCYERDGKILGRVDPATENE